MSEFWACPLLPDTIRRIAASALDLVYEANKILGAPDAADAARILRDFLDGEPVDPADASRLAGRLADAWTHDAVGRAQRAASAKYVELMLAIPCEQIQYADGDWGDSPTYIAARREVSALCGMPVRQRTEREEQERAIVAAMVCVVDLIRGVDVEPHWLRRAENATPDWGQALDADARRRQEAREEILRNAPENERLAALERARDAEWRHTVNRLRNSGMTETRAKEAATRHLAAMGW